jgi:hypothetical protein
MCFNGAAKNETESSGSGPGRQHGLDEAALVVNLWTIP